MIASFPSGWTSGPVLMAVAPTTWPHTKLGARVRGPFALQSMSTSWLHPSYGVLRLCGGSCRWKPLAG